MEKGCLAYGFSLQFTMVAMSWRKNLKQLVTHSLSALGQAHLVPSAFLSLTLFFLCPLGMGATLGPKPEIRGLLLRTQVLRSRFPGLSNSPGEGSGVLGPHLVDVTVGSWGARSGHAQVGMPVPTAVPTPPPFLPSHVLCSWPVASLHAQICVRCVLSVRPSSAPPELLL